MKKLVLLVVLLMLATSAAAQAALDPAGAPRYGTLTLNTGFAPDPASVLMSAGGDAAVPSALGAECAGFVTSVPSVRLTWGGAPGLLRIFFQPGTTQINVDTTMVVHDAAGGWWCSDDTGTARNPSLDFRDAPAGDYEIWVGRYEAGEAVAGELFITTNANAYTTAEGAVLPYPRRATPTAILGVDAAAQAAGDVQLAAVLNVSGAPRYGIATLSPAHVPTPFRLALTPGGSVEVGAFKPECRGYASAEPTVRLVWSGAVDLLRVFYEADVDTALIVRAPDGRYLCVDDSFDSLDPTLDLINPVIGTYDIWVTTLELPGADLLPGVLSITADSAQFPGSTAGRMMARPLDGTNDAANYTASPAAAALRLAAGFAPDPVALPIAAQPKISAEFAGCADYQIGDTPDVRISWGGGRLRLFIVPHAAADLRLIVRAPDGVYVCSQTGLELDAAGEIVVWLGARDAGAVGTLFLTGGDLASAVYAIEASADTPPIDPALLATATPSPRVVAAPTLALDAGLLAQAAAGVSPESAPLLGEIAFTGAPLVLTGVVAGGAIDTSPAALGADCGGYATSAPTISLRVSGAPARLRIRFTPDDESTDTRLLVYDAAGGWRCNDDGPGTLDPLVELAAPPDGVYRVYVAMYAPGGGITGTLRVESDATGS